MPIAFFHQNKVSGARGGIERYLATLVDQGGKSCHVVTEEEETDYPRRCTVAFPLKGFAPRWVGFICGVWKNLGRIRAYLKENDIGVLEFSRPEYCLISVLLPGRKVFTFHGTGPSLAQPGKYLLHHLAALWMPFAADGVQIIGRDAGALPWLVRRIMRRRIAYLDAWYDDVFRCSDMPDTGGPFKLFYAGRLAAMKNPDLLFAIVREMTKRGRDIQFYYFGGDARDIPPDILNNGITDMGYLSAGDLAKAIAGCHMGVLCSGYGEGSPFIVVETLACGRGYVLPPLPGLIEAYRGQTGVLFASGYSVAAYADQIAHMRRQLKGGELSARKIADGVAFRSKAHAAQSILVKLESLAALPAFAPWPSS